MSLSPDGPVLLAEGLGKDFREGFLMKKTSALAEVSFSLEPGVIHGFLGPNGAGKTTTLHLAMGFIKPSRGRITLFGRSPDDRESRRRIGFLPEAFSFDAFTTGRRLLQRFDVLAGNPVQGRQARVDRVLHAVNLADAASRRIRTFSKGMTQRIGLAQALIGDPDLLILDEPMSGMDPATRYSVRQLLADRRDRGKTTLFSSHILSDLEALVDRVVVLDRGRTVADGAPETFRRTHEGAVIVFRHDTPHRFDALFRDRGLTCESTDTPGDLEVEAEDDVTKHAVLRELVSQTANIISVTPRRSSLEDLFLDLASDDDPNDTGSAEEGL